MKKVNQILSIAIVAFIIGSCNQSDSNVIEEQVDEQVEIESLSEINELDERPLDACLSPISPEDSIKYLSKEITVIGDVEHQLTLTVDSLKKMDVVDIHNLDVVCESGASKKENKTARGVLLRDVLDKAKIEKKNHKDRNFYIVARASDNYKATFSWAEIFNNPTGDNVFILIEENGEPIKSQGDMILICQNDIKTGPRHVYWLKSIEVNRVD